MNQRHSMSYTSSRLDLRSLKGPEDNNVKGSKKFDIISKMSKMSDMTNITQSTTNSSTPSRSARFLYLNTLMGRGTVLRPHPRNMMDSLKQLAEEAECLPVIKRALLEHVDEIEKLVMTTRKAGAMMNKSMMYWRMLLKPKVVDDTEVMRMIDSINQKMERIKFQLNLAPDGDLVDHFITARLYQCYIDDGLRIITFDSNDNIKDLIDSAKKMRKSLKRLQKKISMSEYFENVKEWMMDAVVKCYLIMAIDTVTALKLQPLIRGLVKNVKDGTLIETQFVNRLRAFNVSLNMAMIEAKVRRCQTLCPFDEILTKMTHLNNWVNNDTILDYEGIVEDIKRLDLTKKSVQEVDTKKRKPKFCEPVVLRDAHYKIVPEDLFPPFV